MLGNSQLETMSFDGIKKSCHIRGRLQKKVWIKNSDIILIGLQNYQDHKADVILKYNAEEARNLKAYGELLDHVNINDVEVIGMDNDDNITFHDFGGDDDDIDEHFLLDFFGQIWTQGTLSHILGLILVIFEICQFLTIPGPFEYFSENGWSQKIKIFLMKEQSFGAYQFSFRRGP